MHGWQTGHEPGAEPIHLLLNWRRPAKQGGAAAMNFASGEMKFRAKNH
jgi:hypothetical protein